MTGWLKWTVMGGLAAFLAACGDLSGPSTTTKNPLSDGAYQTEQVSWNNGEGAEFTEYYEVVIKGEKFSIYIYEKEGDGAFERTYETEAIYWVENDQLYITQAKKLRKVEGEWEEWRAEQESDEGIELKVVNSKSFSIGGDQDSMLFTKK